MLGEPVEAAGDWEADKRDRVADGRDATADQRDVAADGRDGVADRRDGLADTRQIRLLAWERQLEARARRLGLVAEDGSSQAESADASSARDDAADERAAQGSERQEAAAARDAAAVRRSAKHRDALLAATFAGIAERLYESQTAEQLLTRVAEAAVATIAGSTRSTVTIAGTGQGPHVVPATGVAAVPDDAESALTFPFAVASEASAEHRSAVLNVFASDPAALDQVAEDIGVVLAAHASLASRAVGERLTLEGLIANLEQALLSRDVIGQAKGILMERLKTTPDGAFQVLRRSSQLLNIKLRDVARTLAETGQIRPDHLIGP